MMVTTGAAPTVLYTIGAEGRLTSVASNDPYFRLFRALADLFMAGEIDADELSQRVNWDGRTFACPAAMHMIRSITLALDAPDCPHKGNGEAIACGCEPMDRRARLRELLGD